MANKKRNTKKEVSKMRSHLVVKSNELIQKRTHMMSLQEQKIILFLISQLKPEQEKLEPLTFDIIDFCEICGIDSQQGRTYKELKKTILALSNKGFWVIGKESEDIARWIKEAKIMADSGQITVELDQKLSPFLLQLKARYTQYELIYTLGMKSKYSVRLYEILKSYQKVNEPIHFSLDRFKELVGAEYERWVDVKRFVVEIAIKEINKLSDIFVTYDPIKKGRSVAYIDFEIVEKTNFSDKISARQAIAQELDGIEPTYNLKGQLDFEGNETTE